MKIVVVGGTGLIGSKLVAGLGEQGHDAVPASPNTGVDTLTGEGLAEVVTGADVVIDVSNSPSFADADVLEFFETSTRNLLAASAAAGVGHYVALSVVGTAAWAENGYFRAKLAQEALIEKGPVPYSIVHGTQFFEFVGRMADEATSGSTVRMPTAFFQPVSGADIAAVVGRTAVGAPVNGHLEAAGPEAFRMGDFFAELLAARKDPRTVVSSPEATYFGSVPGERVLLPGSGAVIAETRYRDWAAKN